jgi:hypothetical protein
MSRRRRGAWFDVALSSLIALVVLGPVLVRRGFVLQGDLVFVPGMPWKGAWLGLDGRIPRFVPGDAFTATLGVLLPGDVVEKLVLLGIFVVGGMGMGRLTRHHGAWARASAITFFLWNPWVLERLAIGQWGVVVGYAFLPWVVLAAEHVRDGDPDGQRGGWRRGWRGGWPGLVAWLGAAAVFSPASALMAVAVALAVLAVRPRLGQLLGVAGVALVVNLPWIVPALATAPRVRAPDQQFQTFLPRAESSLGAAASVLSLGGIWKSSVVPGERAEALVVAFSLALTGVAVGGLLLAARTQRSRILGLGTLAVVVLLLGVLTTVPVVATHLDTLARAFPPTGLVRDAHRFLGPAALALSLGLAASVDRVLGWVAPGREALRAVAALLVLAPVLALPSFAWGLAGRWHPVEFPREWSAVRQVLPAGRTVVLPWTGGYRGFSWNQRHAGFDPAPRFFPGDVLVDDRVYVGKDVLSSEDPLLDDVRRALDSADPVAALRGLGVRNVLEEKEDLATEPDLRGGRVLHDGPGLRLVDLGTVRVDPPGRPSTTRRDAVVATDVAVLAGWLTAVGLAIGLAFVAWRRASHTSCSVRPHSDTGEGP